MFGNLSPGDCGMRCPFACAQLASNTHNPAGKKLHRSKKKRLSTGDPVTAGMQQKRTASLPIFNRGKRPRQALLTHPNNVDGVCGPQLQQRRQDAACWNNSPPCSRPQQPRWDQPRYSDGQSTQRYNKSTSTNVRPQSNFTPGRMTSGGYENFQTPPAHSRHQTMSTTTSSSVGNRQQQSSSYPGTAIHSQPPTNSRKPGGFSPYFPPSNKGLGNQPPPYKPTVTHSTQSFSRTERPQASFPPGRATEPALHHSARTEPSPSPVHVSIRRQSHLPRVLTATARGVGHWSKFKAQIPMLFEVIGTLDSAVVAGPVGSREFRLQAGDGVLRCLYWEIDTTLPHLVRGKPIRVVGGWEERQEWLKCHSVREASQEEVVAAGDLVAVCDAIMRGALARTPEM